MGYRLKNQFVKLNSSERLHTCPLPIIAITGGISSGKSSFSKLLKEIGLLVIDADQLVKKAYKLQSVLDELLSIYPQVLKDAEVDFKELRKWAFSNQLHKEKLEKIIYPHLPTLFREALQESPESKTVIYDIPLLFEKNLDSQVDLKVCLYVSEKIQIDRLIKRDSLEHSVAVNIIKQQMPLEFKAKKCDYVIDNSKSIKNLKNEVTNFIHKYLEIIN